MSARCLLCAHTPKTGAVLCWKHADALEEMIDPGNQGRPEDDVAASIPNLWAKLDPTPVGGGRYDERRPPGFGSKPAANLHVLVMGDDRSRNDPQVWYGQGPNGRADLTRPYSEEPNPPRPTRWALDSILRSLLEQLEIAGPWLPDGSWLVHDDVQSLCATLHRLLPDLIAHRDVDDIYLDLLELSDQLRRAVGDATPGPEGWCIELVRDRYQPGLRECGGPLALLPPTPDEPAPPDETTAQTRRRENRERAKEVARCPRCFRRYSWLDLIRIRYVNEPATNTT